MNKLGSLGVTFGQQIVSVPSDKPISEHEKADLVEMKKVLDQKLGKDVVDFRLKDDKNIEIVVNDPTNPKREEYIANQLRQMATAIHPQTPPPAATPKYVPASQYPVTGGNLNVVA